MADIDPKTIPLEDQVRWLGKEYGQRKARRARGVPHQVADGEQDVATLAAIYGSLKTLAEAKRLWPLVFTEDGIASPEDPDNG